MKTALALFVPAALVLAAIYTSQARASEHEHEKEYCEHHEVHEVVFHEPAREPVAHEVTVHRELREREPRDDCHNQWIVDEFCKARGKK